MQRWRGLRRYRCRECRRTFYHHLPPGEQELSERGRTRLSEWRARNVASGKSGRLRRHSTELLLFLCLVVIFYAALKYLAHVP